MDGGVSVWQGAVEVAHTRGERKGNREEKHLAAPHNNPIRSLINDVMKANSVKIACKLLDRPLNTNYSLL